MIPIVNKKYKYIFYYNPKSACSFYRQVFVDLHKEELQESLGFYPTRKTISKILKPKRFNWYLNYYRFSIVRNPYDRLVSSYLDKCLEITRPPQERFKNEYFIDNIHKPIFKFLDENVDFNKGYTFNNLILYLLKNIDSKTINEHFDRQYNLNVPLNSYYKIEDNVEKLFNIYANIFSKNTNKLDELKNIIESYSHNSFIKNETQSKKLKKVLSNIDLSNKSFEDLNTLYKEYNFDYNCFITPSNVEKINTIYNIDFKKFKYEKRDGNK